MARVTARLNQTLAVLLVAFGLSVAVAPIAQAEDGQLASYNAVATVERDGTLRVEATLTFSAAPPASLQQVFTTSRRTAQATEYRFTITDVTATSQAKPLDAKVTSEPTAVRVDIPTAGLTEPVKLAYTVRGAAVENGDGSTLLVWPMLQGLSVGAKQFNATVKAPAQFTQLDCAAGDPQTPGNCTFYGGGNHDTPLPVFRQDGNRAGEVVVITLGFPASQIAANQDLRELWTIERAFSAEPLPLGVGLGLLILGAIAIWAAHRKIGRDYSGDVAPLMVAEFEPTGAGQTRFKLLDGVRPGTIGTLADERVDPVDVTATILDLAIRGHLLITELPRESEHAPTDWSFTRKSSADPLLDYERSLLDAVAPIQGDAVKLSHLLGSLHSVIGVVQSQLYDEVVKAGWFVKRPDSTRDRWGLASWILLGAATLGAALLIMFTSFGLLGLAMVLVALGLVFISREMPARTAVGTAVLKGLDVLRGNLMTHPVANLSVGDVYGQISPLLPYAVVLGGRERWLEAMAEADDDDLPDSTDLAWYHGPHGWHFAHLPASLANFVTTVQGTLFSR